MMVMQQTGPAQTTDPAVEDELDLLPAMPIVQLRAGIAHCFEVFRQSRSGRICSGAASPAEFNEKASPG
jgi:hypothetical protein